MQIVIEISEQIYKQSCVLADIDGSPILKAIKNGTPLPKGHGDLKDTEKLRNAFAAWSMAVHGEFTDADIASIIYNSPTIIEADKTESEG